MNIEQYENATHDTAIYPGAGHGGLEAINYATLGLVGEAGEVANKLKKVYRDDDGVLRYEKREELLAEVGDILWYVVRLIRELGYSTEDVMTMNISKLRSRQNRNQLHGSGDNR